MAGGFDPTWIEAGLAAGATGLGAYRWYRRSSSKRRERQTEYQFLWHAVFGKPALQDKDGIELAAAEDGLVQKERLLEGAFYGHTTHPPHPGRRRDDGVDRGS